MNIDDYESLPTTSVSVNMTAGAIAGVLEHIVMYPMDSVKVCFVYPRKYLFTCNNLTLNFVYEVR